MVTGRKQQHKRAELAPQRLDQPVVASTSTHSSPPVVKGPSRADDQLREVILEKIDPADISTAELDVLERYFADVIDAILRRASGKSLSHDGSSKNPTKGNDDDRR